MLLALEILWGSSERVVVETVTSESGTQQRHNIGRHDRARFPISLGIASF